jgi:stage II sporulation protein AA (anti-sigma F factor antagonist)
VYGDDDVQPTVTVERSGRRAAVKLWGDLDVLVEDEVARTISAAASEPGVAEIHVDALAVTFIDSSGLRGLLAARQAAIDRGRAFRIRVAAHGPVKRLLAITGLEEVLAAEHVPVSGE